MVTDANLVALFVPKTIDDVASFVGRRHGPLDLLCLHEEPRSTGRWVCLLPVGHTGLHG